jgi:hypothetical protein
MKIIKTNDKINIEFDITNEISNLKNGDYKILHLYDETELKKNIKLSKIDQLIVWVNQTFKYTNNNNLINNEIIIAVHNLFNSNEKDLVTLIEWLNKDNYD